MDDWRWRAAEAERKAARAAVVIVAVAVVVLFAMASSARCEVPSPDTVIVEMAATCGCDAALVRTWLEMERAAGVPSWMTGALAATACNESRCTADALGDWRVDMQGLNVAKAVGMFQLWRWAERLGADRRDPVSSARVYLGQIAKSVTGLRRRCGKVRKPWAIAWIRVNRGPRWRSGRLTGKQRCHGTLPGGLRRLKRWLRAARKRWPALPPVGPYGVEWGATNAAPSPPH